MAPFREPTRRGRFSITRVWASLIPCVMGFIVTGQRTSCGPLSGPAHFRSLFGPYLAIPILPDVFVQSVAGTFIPSTIPFPALCYHHNGGLLSLLLNSEVLQLTRLNFTDSSESFLPSPRLVWPRPRPEPFVPSSASPISPHKVTLQLISSFFSIYLSPHERCSPALSKSIMSDWR